MLMMNQHRVILPWLVQEAPSPQEMERLTDCWRPYRSLGSFFMWRVIDKKRAAEKSAAAAAGKKGSKKAASKAAPKAATTAVPL